MITDEEEEKIKEKNEIQNKIKLKHAEKKRIEKRKLKLEDQKIKKSICGKDYIPWTLNLRK